MTVILGQLATPEGHLQHRDSAGDIDPSWLPAVGYLRHQPATVPVYFDEAYGAKAHDLIWQVGERVGHYERSKDDGLLSMAKVSDDLADVLADVLADGPWFLSAGCRTLSLEARHRERALLSEVSIVRDPAYLGLKPLCWSRSNLPPQYMPLNYYETWYRGCEAMATSVYRRAKRLEINDLDPLDWLDELVTDPTGYRRAAAAAAPKTAPAPASKREPTHAGLRLDGVWRGPEALALLTDLLESGCSLAEAGARLRAGWLVTGR